MKVGLGTDYRGWPVEQSAREFALHVEVGRTPMKAIQAATRVNAELLGWDDKLGTLEAGKLGDLVAVPGDPLADMSELERVTFVMLGGRIIRQDQDSTRPPTDRRSGGTPATGSRRRP